MVCVGVVVYPNRRVGNDTGRCEAPVPTLRRQRGLSSRVIPALSGAMLVVNARLGEQQRPTQVARGMIRRLLPGLWAPAPVPVGTKRSGQADGMRRSDSECPGAGPRWRPVSRSGAKLRPPYAVSPGA
jgi:hypothetical protein